MNTLTKRILDAAKPREREHFIGYTNPPGFGVRVYPSGKKISICQSRIGRATGRIKIDPHGPFTVEQARQRAAEIRIISPKSKKEAGSCRDRVSPFKAAWAGVPSTVSLSRAWI